METTKGHIVDQLPLKLRHIIDLIYFEGPLLSVFKNESDDLYFYYWCDIDTDYNRWIIFRIIQQDLKEYLLGKISLSNLIVKPVDGFVYIVDIDDELNFHNVCIAKPSELPQSYVPKKDSLYDLETEIEALSKKEKLLLLSFIIDEKDIIKHLLKHIIKHQIVLKETKDNFFDILFTMHEREKQLKTDLSNSAHKFPFLDSQLGALGMTANDTPSVENYFSDSNLRVKTLNYPVYFNDDDILIEQLS